VTTMGDVLATSAARDAFYAAKVAYLRHAEEMNRAGGYSNWPVSDGQVDAMLVALGHAIPGPVMDGKKPVKVWLVSDFETLPQDVQGPVASAQVAARREARRNTHGAYNVAGYVVASTAIAAARIAARAGHWRKAAGKDAAEVPVTSPIYAAVAARPGFVLVAPDAGGDGRWVRVEDLRPNQATS
jgi:hypothetical protein